MKTTSQLRYQDLVKTKRLKTIGITHLLRTAAHDYLLLLRSTTLLLGTTLKRVLFKSIYKNKI